MSEKNGNLIHAEAILCSKFGTYFMDSDTPLIEIPLDTFEADCHTIEAQQKLTALGFNIVASSPFALSITGTIELFEKVFDTTIQYKQFNEKEQDYTHLNYSDQTVQPTFIEPPIIPVELKGEVKTIFIPPFIKFLSFPNATPSPQTPTEREGGCYPLAYLTPRDLCKRELLNGTNLAVSGKGIKVAMLDTGLNWSHPYYQSSDRSFHEGSSNNNGKYYTPSIWESNGIPAAGSVMYQDEDGHGTAMASNLLAIAPDCTFLFVKTSQVTALEAFKNTRDKFAPNVMSCSWYVPLGANSAQTIKLWEAEISLATQKYLTTIVFACGNLKPEPDYPSCSQYVISVGGTWPVYDSKGLFSKLSATRYATSGINKKYPKRQCPNVCGICGPIPSGWMIMMPTKPGSRIDVEFSNSNTLNSKDGTDSSDGWVVASGTSAATAQMAGVAALLLSKNPKLKPSEVLNKLESSASTRIINDGYSASGETPARGACGKGLVDINAALALV
jgi:serine protease AprX